MEPTLPKHVTVSSATETHTNASVSRRRVCVNMHIR